MDIKLKTSDIRTWEKHLFLDISSINTDILVPSLYQCVETRNIELFWLLSRPLPHLRLNIFVIIETFATKPEKLYATNTSHRKQETFLYEYPSRCVILPTKTHNKTLLFGSTILKHGRHFDYWNQPLNMRQRVCCLDFHVAGLCCYLVMHIEDLLRPLQPFYFHLWLIYWLSYFLLINIWESR
jgi:hypothetical protein